MKITKDGTMFLGKDAVQGGNNSSSDAPRDYWTIGYEKKEGEPDGPTYISYAPKGGERPRKFDEAKTWQELENNRNLVYIGTDGIALGKRFSVSQGGVLKAYSGTIGGWNITSTQILSDKLILDKSGWIRGGDHAVNNGEHNSKGWSI